MFDNTAYITHGNDNIDPKKVEILRVLADQKFGQIFHAQGLSAALDQFGLDKHEVMAIMRPQALFDALTMLVVE